MIGLNTRLMTEDPVRRAVLRAQGASREFRKTGLGKRDAFFQVLAEMLQSSQADILKANEQDLKEAEKLQLSKAMVDRLRLDDKRLGDLIQSVLEIAAFEDPLDISEGHRLKNGLLLNKVKTGIGVVGFIYESRPGVTIDAVALCIKSGNAIVLKGGKEAVRSNLILESICRMALKSSGLPDGLVSLLDSTDRAVVKTLAEQEDALDLIIPRGGPGLIQHVVEVSRVPVIKHDAGNCHIYVHASADVDMALRVIVNAKVSRPGVCNACESLLIDEKIGASFIKRAVKELKSHAVECFLCPEGLKILPDEKPANDSDYGKEYLDLAVSIKIVAGLEEAISHIDQYGTGHTDAILTSSFEAAETFTRQVDSSVVMVNASTRFSDGGQFGLGAEIGISTNRLHARGPMGAHQLTTYKYVIQGQGQVRT